MMTGIKQHVCGLLGHEHIPMYFEGRYLCQSCKYCGDVEDLDEDTAKKVLEELEERGEGDA